MTEDSNTALNDVERLLKQRFSKEGAKKSVTPSTAKAPASSERIDQLVLPDNERGRMPLTKDKYLVKENDALVAWEREVRKFLRRLSPQHGHRVSAAMVYEWATGISTADLVKAGGSTADLKKINKILEYYFGKPYMTYIAGRKVPRCFIVKPGYYIRRHRPMTLTLWAEYQEGALYP